MPSRLIRALCALLLTITASASVAPVAASPAGLTGTDGSAVPVARFQDEALTEDELSSFTMPGLAPDNFTETVLADIDAFWAGELGNMGYDYYAAGMIPVSDIVYSSCGEFGPYDNPAAYCPLDEALYYSAPLSQEIQTTVGDFAWITVLAHEWGHHLQILLGIEHELSIDRELQADCFSGAYAQHALQVGFLQEGDVTEGALMTILGGDPIEMDEMTEGAHGSSDYRLTAFMEGYFNGAGTCLEY
jgi:predicted metalloprotease